MSHIAVKLAKDAREVASAQRLRFEVFNLEMKLGLEASYASGLDQDEFDPLCDHLLIVDEDKGRTIGTYRLLLRSRLGRHGRFYSENEFDLSNIHKLNGEIMEMGRSCVHKDYRRNAVIHLLWNGILQYLKERRVAYIIGCPSVYDLAPRDLGEIYALLKKSYFAAPKFRVVPRPEHAVSGLEDHIPVDGHERRIFLKLPALVRSYLKIGAVICGPPAKDHQFGTVDFFALLDVARISAGYLDRLRVNRF